MVIELRKKDKMGLNFKNLLLENRGTKRTIFKNTFWLALAEVVQKGVGFLVAIWLARHFGPSIYGQWMFALSFVVIFSVLANFGFNTLVVREVARDKSKITQYINNIFAMKLVLGLVTLGLIVFVIQWAEKEQEVVKLVYFLGIYMVINTFATFFQSIFRARQKMQYETACRGLQALSLLGLIGLLIFNKSSIIAVSYAYISAAIIGFLFSAIFTWRYFAKFFFKIDLKVCREILKKAWPFALSAIAITVYYRIDTVMLGLFKEDQVVGYYGAAYNIVLLIIGGIGLLVAAIFPILSNLYKSSIDKFKVSVNLSFKLIMLLSLPVIILIFFFSKSIVTIIYGNEFAAFSSPILQILIWSVLILYNYAIFAIGLSASDKQKIYLKGVIYGAVFNVLANLLVIPKYSYYGAAATTVLTEVVVGSYMSHRFLNLNKMKLPSMFIWKVTLASLVMIVTIFSCRYFKGFNLTIASMYGLTIYVLMTYILKVSKRSLWAVLKTGV